MAGRRIGIDTGGTFTDIAVLRRDGLSVHKVASTPDDPGRAVLAGLDAVRKPAEEVDVVHGTTVGINAILTDNLARTAFVTNEGFEDLIEIGRQERSDLYDLGANKAQVPVPRRLRFGVNTRRGADGTRIAKPTEGELRKLAQRVSKSRSQTIAIGLLHSFSHPKDEKEIERVLRPLGLPITCSSDLLPVSGEFERFTASILNAATRPKLSAYLGSLVGPVRPGQLRLMRSSGGIMSAVEASTYPARAMFSGPAGGVIATRALAARAGWNEVAALDMGGTSTDVCLVRPDTTVSDSTIAGLPLSIPAVEVHTVGCGGGSLARVDAGGALRVGPQSAGADPGPACYGKGTEPTVTDAHIALGHMGAQTLLQGDFPIDPDRSVRAVETLAQKLGLSTRKAAEGILKIAEINMMRALLVITVQRAVDPARVPLIAYGGAGGLHAAGLCRLLEMPLAVVPEHPGAFSAVGLALASESAEHIVPVMRELDSLDRRSLEKLTENAKKKALRHLPHGNVKLTASVRYAGQGRCLSVPLAHPLHRKAAAAHEHLFGFVPQERALELVEIHARVEHAPRKLPLASKTRRAKTPEPKALRRPPVGGTAWPVFDRATVAVGQSLSGPCLLEEFTGVTVVPEGWRCTAHAHGLSVQPG